MKTNRPPCGPAYDDEPPAPGGIIVWGARRRSEWWWKFLSSGHHWRGDHRLVTYAAWQLLLLVLLNVASPRRHAAAPPPSPGARIPALLLRLPLGLLLQLPEPLPLLRRELRQPAGGPLLLRRALHAELPFERLCVQCPLLDELAPVRLGGVLVRGDGLRQQVGRELSAIVEAGTAV